MPEIPPQVDELFDEAIRRAPGAERERFLDDACGNDSDIRRRVERLLRAVANAGSFLESPAQDPALTLDQAPLEQPGSQIGPYKLLQEIGHGGMGVVYLAEQHEPVRRKVALKIIKPGMDTRQVIARFEAERQALSLMDHPNIAKVLDAGTTASGSPYFVMELVKGQPITEYCDERRLSPRQRLEMLVPVCQAIQHAHQKGIIHRDIKPSNILVAEYDEKPVPKVIDFGVAKAVSQPLTERTMFTGIGQIVGTLEYMSPEQATFNQLDFDTRSDVYSLGVLMYELLTGTTPFDKHRLRTAAWDEMLRIIRDEEPPKPSTRLCDSDDSLPSISALRLTEPAKLMKLVRGDLDWIAMKALEKDRSRRYETANGFVADIERYLRDEPVLACPPSLGYRFRKFARRNRMILTASALVALTLVSGMLGTAWQAIQARDARNRAVDSEQRATRNLDRALTAVDQLLTRIGDERLENVPFMEDVRRELLQDALKVYQQMMADGGSDTRVRIESIMAERRMANLLFELGELEKANESIARGLSLVGAVLDEFPNDSTLQLELARGLILQARINEQNLAASTERLRQAVQIIDRLAADSAVAVDARIELALNTSKLGLIQARGGDNAAARVTMEVADRLFGELVAARPTDPVVLRSFAKHLQNSGTLDTRDGDWLAAERSSRKAVEVSSRLLGPGKNHPNDRVVFAIALNNLANALTQQDKHEAALPLYVEATELLRQVVTEYPSIPDYRLRLAGTLMSTAGVYGGMGEQLRGIPLQEEAIERVKFLTSNWPDNKQYQGIHGGALSNLAVLLYQLGQDLERAEVLVLQAIDHQQRALSSPDHPNLYLLNHYSLLAKIQRTRSRWQEAATAANNGLRIGQLLLNKTPNNGLVLGTMAELREIREAATSALHTNPTDAAATPATSL